MPTLIAQLILISFFSLQPPATQVSGPTFQSGGQSALDTVSKKPATISKPPASLDLPEVIYILLNNIGYSNYFSTYKLDISTFSKNVKFPEKVVPEGIRISLEVWNTLPYYNALHECDLL